MGFSIQLTERKGNEEGVRNNNNVESEERWNNAVGVYQGLGKREHKKLS